MLNREEEATQFEILCQSILEQAPIGIIVISGDRVALDSVFGGINPTAEEILGRTAEELAGLSWMELTHPDDLPKALDYFARFQRGEITSYALEERVIRPDKSLIWVQARVSALKGIEGADELHLCLLEDITVRKKMEEALLESERSKSVLLSHLPGMAYRTRYDRAWTLEYVSDGCRALTGYEPENLLYNRDLSFNDLIHPDYREPLWEEWKRAVGQRRNFRAEYEIITKEGERKWVLELGQAVYRANGSVEALEGIILDITNQKKREARITYLRRHDFLTGLFNRPYLEEEKQRLDQPEHWPLSVLFCDINGLRMINDAYGQEEGDRLIVEAAKLIRNVSRPEDIIARLGGGEFLLLLPNTDHEAAEEFMQCIAATVESYNRSHTKRPYELSLSMAHNTKEIALESLAEVIKTAEENLHHRKVLNQRSSHNAIVRSVLATLYAKSQETEEHGQRMAQLSTMIGRRLGLEQEELDQLQLLAILHDIGKIGVDDSILNKPGRLTAGEWEQMKLHPEIGHRIAMSTPQFRHIADFILHHHERWDGTGYPRGLAGEEIRLLSRILTVVDAYDAMTEERVYSSAKSHREALAEIKRCAGTQFDPQIANIFMELMEE